MADQVDWPDIYIDSSVGDGGVGSEADPYNNFTDINWGAGGDNSVTDWYVSPTASVTINLQRGEEWREEYYPGVDGTADYPIILRPYGTGDMPHLKGSILVTGGWTQCTADSDCWKLVVTTWPRQVFMDGQFGTETANDGENLTSQYDWTWDEDGVIYDDEVDTLYIWTGSANNPGTYYTDPGVEVSQRQVCMGLGYDYSVIDGIMVSQANRCGVYAWVPGNYITVKNCLAEWCYIKGIAFEGDGSYHDCIFEDNTARYCGNGGIGMAGISQNCIVRRNTAYENGKFQDGDFEAFFEWTFGIAFWEGDGLIEGLDVYENVCYENGRGHAGDQPGRGVGIWFDTLGSQAASNRCRIRHNIVYDNQGHGIFLELTSNTDVYGNVLYGNANVTGGSGSFGAASIAIDARDDNISRSDYNRIYNNTVVDSGRYGLKIVTYNPAAGTSVSGNIVKNNIIVTSGEYELYCDDGGDNDTWGSGNVYESNCLGVEAISLWWGGSAYTTYDSWITASSQTDNNIEDDPDFFDDATDKYWLATGSPCIGAGVEL